MAAPAWEDREFDAVVYGATGDTGTIGSCWLYFYGKKLGFKTWAPAARNLDKMKQSVLDNFEGKEPGEDGLMYGSPIKADASDYESLLAMCRRTKLVIACAGPYEVFGEPVMQACIEVGTHYVDVTGETWWVGNMEAKYGEQALAKGVTLISCAGYDSIPPDLSTNLAAMAIKEQGEVIDRFHAFLSVSGGAMPSGTIETAFLMVDNLRAAFYGCITCGLYTCFCGPKTEVKAPETSDVEAAKQLQPQPKSQYIPVAEVPNKESNGFWNMFPGWSSLGRRFSILHFMAPININVVHRTAAQEGYGGLTYRERMTMGVGCCSLWGLLPTMFAMLFMVLLIVIALCPCGGCCIRKCILGPNPGMIATVKSKMFNRAKGGGAFSVTGFGVSKSGKTKVEVFMESKYDSGLGFTMQSATTVGGLLVKRYASGDKPRAGFQTAVHALGGQQLFDGLQHMGVTGSVTVTKV